MVFLLHLQPPESHPHHCFYYIGSPKKQQEGKKEVIFLMKKSKNPGKQDVCLFRDFYSFCLEYKMGYRLLMYFCPSRK